MGYIDEADIQVYVVGELDGGGNQLYRAFTFDSEFVVNVTLAIDNPSSVVVQRTVSPTVFKIDFRTGDDITETNLMEAFEHNFMLMQEILDGRIDGIDIDQRATDAETAATGASASETAAAASAAAAAASAASINLTDYIKKDGTISMEAELTLVAPTSDLHAATKKYVDDSVGGGGAMLLDGSAQMTGAMLLKAATAPTLDDHASNKKYVDDQDTADASNWAAADALLAPLASPALTGNPTVPTATPGDNDTSAASTAFVTAAIAAAVASDANTWTFVENVYEFAVDGIVASVESADWADNFEYMLTFDQMSNNDGGNTEFTIDIFPVTLAAYQGQRKSHVNVDSSHLSDGSVIFNMPRVSKTLMDFTGHFGDSTDLTRGFSGAWSLAAADKIQKIKLAFTTSSIDGGIAALYKRAIT